MDINIRKDREEKSVKEPKNKFAFVWSKRGFVLLRHSGITGQITVSTVSQLDLSDNQSSSRKACNPGLERLGQGQRLGVMGLTDKGD